MRSTVAKCIRGIRSASVVAIAAPAFPGSGIGRRTGKAAPERLLVTSILVLGVAGCGGDDRDVAGPEDLAPSFAAGHSLTLNPGEQYTVGVAVNVTLPEASGGNPPLTYSLTPSLPAGLAFSATTRAVSGTPTTLQPRTQYAYRVTDTDGDAATVHFGITIEAACTVGQVVRPGNACRVGTHRFEVLVDGRARYHGVVTVTLGLNQTRITVNGFSAERISDTNDWRVVSLP